MFVERDEDPRRAGPRARGGHVDDDRHAGIHDALDDRAGRFEQAAGGVEDEDEALGAVPLGPLDGADDVLLGHRADDLVIQLDDIDVRRLRRGRECHEQKPDYCTEEVFH